jgi:hypothetical protein
MAETIKNNTESVADGSQANQWENIGEKVEAQKAADYTKSKFWANELEAISKQHEESKQKYKKQNLLGKIKARIVGSYPNKKDHEAELAHAHGEYLKATKEEDIEAGVATEEMYPDRVEDADKAYEMAKASDKYETKAAKLHREVEEEYGDMSSKQYLNKVDKIAAAKIKADSAAQKAAENYDNAKAA